MVYVVLLPMLNVFCFYIGTFQSLFAVPNMAVFCSSLISCVHGNLLRYFLNDCEMVPVAPSIIGITSVFIFHMCCISILRSSYFRFLIGFILDQISVS
jgi:hypothetical protein